jgi:hypothetical protein
MSQDYSKIQASPVWGPEIGRLFMNASPFITTLAREAYAQFADQVNQQFERMLSTGLYVSFQDEDPYTDASDMFYDVLECNTLRVYRTSADQRHPILSDETNNRFRAVHDFYGHLGSRRGFDRHGEEAAWVKHSPMFTGLARRAMTTETRGQSSALCWITSPDFPEQKAVLLPDWVSEIPAQYSR